MKPQLLASDISWNIPMAEGPMGPQGPGGTGPQGATGAQGSQGISGTPGAQGVGVWRYAGQDSTVGSSGALGAGWTTIEAVEVTSTETSHFRLYGGCIIYGETANAWSSAYTMIFRDGVGLGNLYGHGNAYPALVYDEVTIAWTDLNVASGSHTYTLKACNDSNVVFCGNRFLIIDVCIA